MDSAAPSHSISSSRARMEEFVLVRGPCCFFSLISKRSEYRGGNVPEHSNAGHKRENTVAQLHRGGSTTLRIVLGLFLDFFLVALEIWASLAVALGFPLRLSYFLLIRTGRRLD